MEESYIEGLATHGDPDHALALVRVTAKRWTGARAGRAIEPRNHCIRGADDVYEIGRPHRPQRYRELLTDPAPLHVREPLHARNLLAREPGDLVLARQVDHRAGRSGKAKAASLRWTSTRSQTAPYYRRTRRTRP